MIFQNYGSEFLDGIQYLVALGSMIGLLGLVMGLFLLILGSKRARVTALGMIVFSFLLVSICGLDTGVKYFRIRIY